ncbi:hypothetical protein GWK47_007178 [Chionoecetes opilio]|uniref:Uncharacterized protein n=1 Tax=Chionoecetes opilio TaxID=41210 RepID=A0A8J5CT08_CHIOP|nr:hypothetical protein GWK47_007178 [Chionoecetes opilio]
MSRGITGTAAYTSDKATEPEPASGSDRCSEGERAQKELPAAPQQGRAQRLTEAGKEHSRRHLRDAGRGRTGAPLHT